MKLHIFTLLLLVPVTASARDFTTVNLPYSDPPTDRATQIAIGVLTDEGIVEGNPDGTYRADAQINRAEFTKIAVGFLPNSSDGFSTTCFSDIEPEAWFAPYVCFAKSLGIVGGNAIEGLQPNEWPFAPSRNVNYAEAIKILAEIFDLEIKDSAGKPWYEPYFVAARARGLLLPDALAPGHLLTRGQMTRLALRYYANNKGELTQYLEAVYSEEELTIIGREEEDEEDVQAESSSQSSAKSLEQSAVSSQQSAEEEPEETSNKPVVFDTQEVGNVVSDLILMGGPSPVLGAASIFSEAQPLAIREFMIQFIDPVDSFHSVFVYDHDGKFLGSAVQDPADPTKREFILPVSSNEIVIDQQEDYTFYVRGNTKLFDDGAESGEIVRINKMGVRGDGVWNNKTQTEYSTDSYSAFQVVRTRINKVDNPYNPTNILIAGNQIRIGSFRFKGEAGPQDGSAKLRVTDLTINVDQTGGVTLTNVRLGADGTNDKMNCVATTGKITCNSIEAKFGDFEDIPRILSIYADVAIPAGSNNPRLQLRLNDPGDPYNAGAVRWTDGTSAIHWTPGPWPLASSTSFE